MEIDESSSTHNICFVLMHECPFAMNAFKLEQNNISLSSIVSEWSLKLFKILKMIKFEDFFVISHKCLRMIGLDMYYVPPVTKREVLKERLIKTLLWVNILCAIGSTILLAIYIVQNNGDLKVAGTACSNFILFVITESKTIHMTIKWKKMMAFKDKLRMIFESPVLQYYDRYQKNLKVNNIIFQTYFLAVYGASILFCLMPIIENVVNMMNGSDRWERILIHQAYLPFDYEPIFGYICAYILLIFLSIVSNNFITANEIFFDSLLVILSTEFDNLGDEFENFDFKHGDYNDFKKLVDRHNVLHYLSNEMNSIFSLPIMITFLGSTILLCFSLLQFFMHELILTNLVNLIKFGAYLNAVIIQIFLLCYFCQKLRTSSENVGRKIIRSNWHESSNRKMIKSLQLVLLKSQRPVELTALSFFGVDLEVFTSVSKLE